VVLRVIGGGDHHPHPDLCPPFITFAAQHSVPVFTSATTTTLESWMTSFIVEAHVDRPIRPEWADNPHCVFCLVLENKLPAYISYEDDKVIAILGRSPYNAELKQKR